jgi:hypothetical protein
VRPAPARHRARREGLLKEFSKVRSPPDLPVVQQPANGRSHRYFTADTPSLYESKTKNGYLRKQSTGVCTGQLRGHLHKAVTRALPAQERAKRAAG